MLQTIICTIIVLSIFVFSLWNTIANNMCPSVNMMNHFSLPQHVCHDNADYYFSIGADLFFILLACSFVFMKKKKKIKS